MTVSSTTNRVDYVGTGITGPYSYPFRIQTETDLTVTVATSAGVETTLTYLTDYTVSGARARNGGSITLTTALATGYALTIRRVVPLTQLTNIRNQGPYFPETVEDALDRGVMMAQQIDEVNVRAMTLPVTATGVSGVLPLPVPSDALFWKVDGTGLENRPIDTSGIAIPGGGRTVATATALLANDLGTQYNVLDFAVGGAAINNGVVDATVSLNNAVTAMPAGSTMRWPPGTYKITGDVTFSKAMTVILDGVTINSTAGRLLGLADNVTLDGCGTSRMNFASGAPASSLDRAVRFHGSYNGSLLPITGTITGGVLTFVATNAADVVGMAAGDWLIVGEFNSDWQRQEWKQVKTIAGTTITVTTPFRNTLNTYTRGFYRVTPVQNGTVRGLYIVTSSTVDDNYGVDSEICRNFTLEHCRFDIAKGMAWQTYLQDAPTIRENVIDRQVGRRASVSACIDGKISHNRWNAKGGLPTNGAMSIETGTNYCDFDDNVGAGVDLSGVFAIQWCDNNRFNNNTASSDGTSIGFFVLGGDNNQFRGNRGFKVLETIRFDQDTGLVPTRTANTNSSFGDAGRFTTRGVNIRAGTVGNEVVLFDYDTTVGTGLLTDAVLDSGTTSTVFIRDIATGLISFVPATLPREIALAGAPSSIVQLLLGTSSNVGSLCTAFSSGSPVIALNAVHIAGSDLWHQSNAALISACIRISITGVEVYKAAAGTANGTFATFWGTSTHEFNLATGNIAINGTRVLIPRQAAITSPTAPSAGYVQAEAAAMKTAMDAVLARLAAAGITA